MVESRKVNSVIDVVSSTLNGYILVGSSQPSINYRTDEENGGIDGVLLPLSGTTFVGSSWYTASGKFYWGHKTLYNVTFLGAPLSSSNGIIGEVNCHIEEGIPTLYDTTFIV